MINLEVISIIVGIFGGLGVLIAGCGFAYAQWKGGGDKFKDNLIQTLKETADAEKQERERLAAEKTQLIISHQVQITQLQKETSELRGRLDEVTKQAGEYKSILQGRDPELSAFIKNVGQTAAVADKVMPEVLKILQELRVKN
jgi:hypothetical protein